MWQTPQLIARIAVRELHSTRSGFAVMLFCLTLGIAAIATIGLLRTGLQNGLDAGGAVMLGGDAEINFAYRFANAQERALFAKSAAAVSEVVDFRSMLVRPPSTIAGQPRARAQVLTQIKAVDSTYPLLGNVVLSPDLSVQRALAGQGDVPGVVLDGLLMQRLDVKLGDQVLLGKQAFIVMAQLISEPDTVGNSLFIGARTLVHKSALAQSGLLTLGSFFDVKYRLMLKPQQTLDNLYTVLGGGQNTLGGKWTDKRNASPAVAEIINRTSAFLLLIGLGGVLIGGIGVSESVRTYVGRKTPTIAILKTLGFDNQIIFMIFLSQIIAVAVLSIFVGSIISVIASAIIPLLVQHFGNNALPLPIVFGVYPKPLFEAAFYGILITLIFTVLPLARTRNVKPTALLRGAQRAQATPFPPLLYSAVVLGLCGVLLSVVVYLSPIPRIVLWASVGFVAALVLFTAMGIGFAHICRLAHARAWIKNHPAWHIACAGLGTAKHETTATLVALGVSLTVLATLQQLSSHLYNTINQNIAQAGPSYFFIDIQQGQLAGVQDIITQTQVGAELKTAPMVRGIIQKVNGKNPLDTLGQHWIFQGDRGITYQNTLGQDLELVDGTWWDAHYQGQPQISFSANEAKEAGLKLGDILTLNILGRTFDTTLVALHRVDFSTAGIGFTIVIDKNTIASAPHTYIATLYTADKATALGMDNTNTNTAMLSRLTERYPNITAVRVSDVIAKVNQMMRSVSRTIGFAASVALIIGFVVLIATISSGQQQRNFEASVLKTLGAQHGFILTSLFLRTLFLIGFIAVLVAVLTAVFSAAIVYFVFQDTYQFSVGSAALTIGLGGVLSLLAAWFMAIYPLRNQPAHILRERI